MLYEKGHFDVAQKCLKSKHEVMSVLKLDFAISPFRFVFWEACCQFHYSLKANPILFIMFNLIKRSKMWGRVSLKCNSLALISAKAEAKASLK